MTYRAFCESACQRHGREFPPQCEGLQPAASAVHGGCQFLRCRHSNWPPCNHPVPAPPSGSKTKTFKTGLSQAVCLLYKTWIKNRILDSRPGVSFLKLCIKSTLNQKTLKTRPKNIQIFKTLCASAQVDQSYVPPSPHPQSTINSQC